MAERKVKRCIQSTVTKVWAGHPLLAYLTSRFTYQGADAWEAELATGRLRVNGEVRDAGHRLALGDVVDYDASHIPEPPVDAAIEILYQDAELMIVNKPGNLPCHPGGRYFNHTLWGLLRAQHGLDEPRLVNRLDRETSGLVLVAKTALAAAACAEQFAGGHVEKRYLAVVEGAFPPALEACGRMEPDPESGIRKRRRFVQVPDGGVVTSSSCVRRSGELSLVDVRPKTGKLHQIRATLCALGYPIVGDKLYGVDSSLFLRFVDDALTPEDRRRLRLDRQALHASALCFRHPAGGRWMAFETPLPVALAALV